MKLVIEQLQCGALVLAHDDDGVGIEMDLVFICGALSDADPVMEKQRAFLEELALRYNSLESL